jgi:catechol 2,3-dioxygenase-like lactoylglutathione lyase family enzyme
MIRTRGLTHIHLVVRELERSLRFYKSVFGMQERFRDGPKLVFLNTPVASTWSPSTRTPPKHGSPV